MYTNPENFLDDLRSCFVETKKATAEQLPSNDITIASNYFPRLPLQIQNTVVAAAILAQKYEDEVKEREREEQEEAEMLAA